MPYNPYSAPLTGPPKRLPESVAGLLRHRTFRNQRWFAFSHRRMMERLRAEAADFVDTRVGVENVVSVAESFGEVVVWYRTTNS